MILDKILTKIDISILLAKLQPVERDIVIWWYLEGIKPSDIVILYNNKYAKTDEECIKVRTLYFKIQNIMTKLRKYAGRSDLKVVKRRRRRKNDLGRNPEV